MTWISESRSTGNSLYGVSFTSSIVGVTVGGAGTILRTITGGGVLQVSTFSSGWNLISNPLLTASDSVKLLYPSCISSSAFGYGPTGYFPTANLERGNGYWGRFGENGSSVLIGFPIQQESVAVAAGWNLIGSISIPIVSTSLQCIGTNIISPVFGYNQGYNISDSIRPGKGYWIKVDSEGIVFLSNGVGTNEVAKLYYAGSTLKNMSRIVIQDQNKDRQELYLNFRNSTDDDIYSYELPPAPPEGNFDVRFASNRMIENHHFALEKHRIIISSAHYPLNLDVSPKGLPENQQLCITDAVGHLLDAVSEGEHSVVQLTNSAITTLFVEEASVPKEYILFQNFPNPFNPTSTIEFGIPGESRVTLKVYDIMGREVQTLLDGKIETPGYHDVMVTGQQLASGIYFYKMEASGTSPNQKLFRDVRKMLFIK